MHIHTISCGTLMVEATEMIRPLSAEQTGQKYALDGSGFMRLHMNALLVNDSDRNILFDPGCADFLPPGISDLYGVEIDVSIEERLKGVGILPEEITDVIFTHLHFDHGSGAFKRVPGNIEKRFINARYHVSREHYNYALKPQRKEARSFFTRFFRYVDRLHWLEDWKADGFEFHKCYGHTYGMVVPEIFSLEMPVYYLSDLIPMEIFLESGTYSGYDLNPELAIREKEDFLNNLTGPYRFIYFHDPLNNSTIYP